MTSSTPIKAATDGMITSTSTEDQHPVRVLRRSEGCGLISLACDAVQAIGDLTHQLHAGIYEPGTIPVPDLQRKLLDTLTCLETAEHYLRMLDEVIDPGDPPAQQESEPPW